MGATEYVIPLAERVRKRHRHEADKGKVTSFAVQLGFSRKISGKLSFVMIRLTDTPIWTDFIAMEERLRKSSA